jgi:hypothetical protein
MTVMSEHFYAFARGSAAEHRLRDLRAQLGRAAS